MYKRIQNITFYPTVQKLSAASLAMCALTLGFSGSAYAHVTVSPKEAATAQYQTFTVNVPNEKELPTISVKILIPDGINNATPTQKAGWEINKETVGSGNNQRTSSITWLNGTIADGMRDEFTFSAKTPRNATDLQWKAYQTYSDGTVVSWDQQTDGSHEHDSDNPNTGPLSVTKVVTETADDVMSKKIDQAAADAKTTAERSFYVGVAALVASVTAIFLAIRRK